ncbi:hypothetical protein XENOCAPTIV_006822 [Xenoophorus captivus]|uniref:Uncharacterized protein n=1 Tax=Xenoophorus captivus TaxID=1517983 RepID=A0ABV0QGV6_9TELE
MALSFFAWLEWMLVVLHLEGGGCGLFAVHAVVFLCRPSACWAGVYPFPSFPASFTVVGRVVHRGVCLTAWLGQVFLAGSLSVGVGCVLLPRLPGCSCGPVPGIGDWALCWLFHVGSGVVGHVLFM